MRTRHREDLHTLLGKAGKNLTVTTLMQTLQQSLEFEAFVSKKYATPVSPCATLGNLVLSMRIIQITDLMKSCSPNIVSANTLESAFESHMGIYVDAQNRSVHPEHCDIRTS